MVTKRVYPDTNVAMHYRPFGEIDWCSLVGADEVVLVINRVFMREIDDLKDHKRGVLQARARRVNAWLGELRKTKNWTIRDHVRVEVNAKEPQRPHFDRHGLEPSVNDDTFVACMVRDAEAHPDDLLVCVTGDNALAFKVEDAGFTVADPPAGQRLPDEPDAAELENRELKKKLIELERRIDPSPDLAVEFPGGANLLGIELSGTRAPSEEYIEEELAAERGMIELSSKFVPAILQRPPSAAAVNAYITRLRKWMIESRDVAVMRAHTFDIQLVLANIGTGNAKDIQVDLTFPENVFVAEKRSLPELEKRPTPPKAEDTFANLGALRAIALAPTYPRIPMRFPTREPERLAFDAKEPHRCCVLIDAIKHRTQIKLPTFQAWFATGSVPNGFEVSFRIHAASPPLIKDGVLRAKVDVRPGPARLLRLDEPTEDEDESDEDAPDT